MASGFDAPTYECDLILKGGITSGVVYPPAIVELARSHRFRNIAGTSAGAIGAAAAAAAEVGRGSDTGGFALLDSVPDELSATDEQGRTKLLRLFQPQHETRPIFDVVWAARQATGSRARALVVLGGVLRQGPLALLVILLAAALVLGALAVVGAVRAGGATSLWLSVALAVALVVLAFVGGLIAVLLLGARNVWTEARASLAGNFHGFVNGSTPDDGDEAALTDWLYDTLQRLAGRQDESQAELRAVPVTHGEVAAAGAQLVTITTNLSRGTSDQIPFHDRIWAFDPGELSKIFPADVVEHMVQHAGTPDRDAVAAALGPRLRLLPPPEQLPIIVTARMSLSFPVLLAAVPLYGVTPERVGDEWQISFVQNWFSDGGITSNLPVHLFDRPLPTRPTYAINLGSGADLDAPACDNVFRPISARQGQLPPTTDIGSTIDLLTSVFDTMQNWSDNNLVRTAGFRERICTIRLGTGEGGMNLDMPPERIASLIDRGRCAGRNLSSMRTGDLADTGIGESEVAKRQWDRHRWTRYRIAGDGLGQLVDDIGPVLHEPSTPTTPSYADLGATATARPSPFPYADDWTALRNKEVATIWESVLDLGGHPPDRFGDGPRGVGLRFAASNDHVEVTPTPPASGGAP
jgi:hypothetical protein